jgi:hypothetical protein
LLLASGVRGDCGDELAGREGETLHAFDDELEVVALGYLGDADFSLKTCGQKLTGQGGFSLQIKDEAQKTGLLGVSLAEGIAGK